MQNQTQWSFNYSELPQMMYSRRTPTGLVDDYAVEPEVKLLALEAQRLGVTWKIVPDSELVKFTYQGRSEYVYRHFHSQLKTVGNRLCLDKDATRAILIHHQLPVSRGFTLTKGQPETEWQAVFAALNKPLVVKQAKGTHGEGVFMDLNDWEEFRQKVATVFEQYDTNNGRSKAIVEETCIGKEYRIIATPDEVLAVMYRQPASVTGDGQHTIQELIEIKNQLPIRNVDLLVYPHIEIDDQMRAFLANQQLSLDSVPATNEVVFLRLQSNIMSGGDAFDLTDEIHPTVREYALKIAQAIPGLPFAGIDFMTTDITKDQATQHCSVIEVNSAPEFAMHDMPMYGKTRGVAKAFLMGMFPELKNKA